MAKMCHCGRGWQMPGKACCQDCYTEIMKDYNEGLFDCSQHSQRLQPMQPPTHDYTAHAVPQRTNAEAGA